MTQLIGENLLQRRRQLGWTQHQLAQRMKTSRAYISQIETGAYGVSLEKLYAFAHHLNVELSAILPSLDRMRTEFGEDIALLRMQRGGVAK